MLYQPVPSLDLPNDLGGARRMPRQTQRADLFNAAPMCFRERLDEYESGPYTGEIFTGNTEFSTPQTYIARNESDGHYRVYDDRYDGSTDFWPARCARPYVEDDEDSYEPIDTDPITLPVTSDSEISFVRNARHRARMAHPDYNTPPRVPRLSFRSESPRGWHNPALLEVCHGPFDQSAPSKYRDSSPESCPDGRRTSTGAKKQARDKVDYDSEALIRMVATPNRRVVATYPSSPSAAPRDRKEATSAFADTMASSAKFAHTNGFENIFQHSAQSRSVASRSPSPSRKLHGSECERPSRDEAQEYSRQESRENETHGYARRDSGENEARKYNPEHDAPECARQGTQDREVAGCTRQSSRELVRQYAPPRTIAECTQTSPQASPRTVTGNEPVSAHFYGPRCLLGVLEMKVVPSGIELMMPRKESNLEPAKRSSEVFEPPKRSSEAQQGIRFPPPYRRPFSRVRPSDRELSHVRTWTNTDHVYAGRDVDADRIPMEGDYRRIHCRAWQRERSSTSPRTNCNNEYTTDFTRIADKDYIRLKSTTTTDRRSSPERNVTNNVTFRSPIAG